MDPTATYLLTQGVLGVAVLVLSSVVVFLYRRTTTLEDEKIALIEARRIDSVDTTKEVIGVLRDNAQNVAILSEKIEVGKRSNRQ